MWGLDISHLDSIAVGASTELMKVAESFFEKEWIQKNDKIITLTKQGKLYADHIASELFF
jgi:oxygen-independent coproporphyrinogen-3 oxidase